MSEQKAIAEEATLQLACAMQHIKWLRGILVVLRDRLAESNADSGYETVADLGIYCADDWHNQLDCDRESLEQRTALAFAEGGSAPRKTTPAKRGAQREVQHADGAN